MGQDIGKITEDFPGTEEFLKIIREIRNEVEEALKKTNVIMKNIRESLSGNHPSS